MPLRIRFFQLQEAYANDRAPIIPAQRQSFLLVSRPDCGTHARAEHLITAGLLLTVGLGTLVLDAGGPVRCFDLAIVGACVGLFLILSCC